MPDQTPSMPPLPEPVEWQYRTHFGGARGWSSWYTEDKVEIDAHPDRHFPAIFEVRGLYTAEQVQAVADERVRAALADLRDEIAEFDHKLVSWANAYPEDVFPKPDLAAVRAALETAGLSLDCVSAHSMRHVASKLSESFGDVRALARPTLSLGTSEPSS